MVKFDLTHRYHTITLDCNILKFVGEPYPIEIELTPDQLIQLRELLNTHDRKKDKRIQDDDFIGNSTNLGYRRNGEPRRR
jgi:hypothetical protein